jgi:imidazolonepropionase-like amidohydrolase
MQSNEFRHRTEFDKPIDALRSATSINAEIIKRKGELGVITPGAKADMILIDGNPLEDIAILERYRSHLPLTLMGGVVKIRVSL